MAKTGHTIITCDNPGCEVTVSVPTSEQEFIPIGWFRMAEARHSLSPFDRKHGRNLIQWDFCSTVCVHAFSAPVEEVIAEKPAPKPARKRKPKPKVEAEPEVVVAVNEKKQTANEEEKANA